jgi:hypothetical protein
VFSLGTQIPFIPRCVHVVSLDMCLQKGWSWCHWWSCYHLYLQFWDQEDVSWLLSLLLYFLVPLVSSTVSVCEFYFGSLIGTPDPPFFCVSRVDLARHNQDMFHFHRTAFYSHLKSVVVNILVKVTGMCVNLDIDDAPITSRSHTPTHKPLVSHSLSST